MKVRYECFPVVGSLGAVLVLILGGCSPDLQETAGPIVPYPNLRGTVVRDSTPVFDRKVKLAVGDTDSTFAEDRTDRDGNYAFSEIAEGLWTIKVSSSDPGDYASISCSFILATTDEETVIPPIDLSVRGLIVDAPQDGAALPLPGFSSPLEFRWTPPAGEGWEAQVRVYDAQGASVWYSVKDDVDHVLWNGIGNQGSAQNRPVEAGSYQWRIRIEYDGSAVEYNTGYRDLTLERVGPL